MVSIKRHIPNGITSLNVACGSLATLLAVYGELYWAVVFIVIASFFDFLDGLVARQLKAYSDMGKELDSLGDMISFGVAPAALTFSMIRRALYGDDITLDLIVEPQNIALLSTAVIMPVFGALRLAKFNVDTTQSLNFKGLPIPANALLICSLVIILLGGDGAYLLTQDYLPYVIAGVALFSSALMVTRYNLFSLKFKGLSFKHNKIRYIMLAIAVAALLLCGSYALFVIMITYILLSLIFFRG